METTIHNLDRPNQITSSLKNKSISYLEDRTQEKSEITQIELHILHCPINKSKTRTWEAKPLYTKEAKTSTQPSWDM